MTDDDDSDHAGACKVHSLPFGRELAGLEYRGCSLRFWSYGQLQVRPHSDEVVSLLESLLMMDKGSWESALDIMDATECRCPVVYWVWSEQRRRGRWWTAERWATEVSRVVGALLDGAERRA